LLNVSGSDTFANGVKSDVADEEQRHASAHGVDSGAARGTHLGAHAGDEVGASVRGGKKHLAAPRPASRLNVSIFLLCWNQQNLLPKVWAYYRTQFPAARFYLIDDGSTDGSHEIAQLLDIEFLGMRGKDNAATNLSKSFGMEPMEHVINGTLVPQFPVRDIHRNGAHNSVWRYVVDPGTWVITSDMDELLCITQEQLQEVDASGATYLYTQGFSMISFSNRTDLSDLDLGSISHGKADKMFDKQIMFKAGPPGIHFMNYGQGSHWNQKNGSLVVPSRQRFKLQHVRELGLNHSLNKFADYNSRHTYFKKSERAHKWLGYYYLSFQQREKVELRFESMRRLNSGNMAPIRECMRKEGKGTIDPSLASQAHTSLGSKIREIIQRYPFVIE